MDQPSNKLALQLGRFLITLLLVVISINVAVLVYARTAARQAEIAVRTALGASRGRIIAQMFTEGLVLAGPHRSGLLRCPFTGVHTVIVPDAQKRPGRPRRVVIQL